MSEWHAMKYAKNDNYRIKPVTLYILSPHPLHSTIQWPFARNSIMKLALSLKVLSHPNKLHACMADLPALMKKEHSKCLEHN